MSANAFLPYGNGLAVNASTTSTGVTMLPTSTIVVTNRSTTSPAWVSWNGSTMPTAAFPPAGDPTGTQGMEVAPGAQVSIGVNGANVNTAVVLLSGTGIVTIVPGDGV
jgi:hypothetical protein